jgi:hypothetical protein
VKVAAFDAAADNLVKFRLVTSRGLCHIPGVRALAAFGIYFVVGVPIAAAQPLPAQPLQPATPAPVPPSAVPQQPIPGLPTQPYPYPYPVQPPRPAQPGPYPVQPGPYPVQPAPYPSPYPTQPNPYPQPYPTQPYPTQPYPTQPYPTQPSPYPTQPSPYPQNPPKTTGPMPNGTTRGALVVNVPTKKINLPEVKVELEGRILSRELYGRPTLIAPGPRLLRVAAFDETGKMVLGPRQELVQIQAGYTSTIDVPDLERTSDGGLLAGGVVVATLGVAATTFAGMSFAIAEEATACTGEGWESFACGYEPGPWVGVGVTSLIFGLSGMIGGSVMIVNGATPELSWVPRVNVDASGAGAAALTTTFTF